MWFDGQADHFDETSGLPPDVGRSIARAIVDRCGCTPHDAILDLGTGTGAIGLHFAGQTVLYLGLDQSLPMLRVFQGKLGPVPAHMLLVQADSDRPWPVKDCAVAVLFASRVVHHLSVPHVAREALRVCRPGGYVLLGRVTRAPESLPTRLQRHKRALLAEHGLRSKGGGEAVQQLVAACCEHGATPVAPAAVARWTRTTTARHILANWQGKPQLMSGGGGRRLDPAEREQMVTNLIDRVRREVDDLDRPEEFAEEYLLGGVKLP